MNNRTVDKRDSVMDETIKTLLELLKEHQEDDFCNYVYLELTLGGILDLRDINRIKNGMLTFNGEFKCKGCLIEHYSMDDLLNCLIEILNTSLWEKKLVDNSEEIIKKYGGANCVSGIGYYLRKVLLNIEEPSVCYNNLKKMIEEYVLRT